MAKLSGNKTFGKQWMPKEEHRNMTRILSQSGGNSMRSTEILSEPMDGRKNIADTSITSRRSTSLTPHPGIRGAGTRAPSRWHATMRIVKLDQWKQEEISDPLPKFSQVFDKNLDDRIPLFRRTRRPFDEARRAELEWMSHNWSTYFSQPSSSSSSQNWWQHEHPYSQWREHQDTQWRRSPMERSKMVNSQIFPRSFAYRKWRFPCKRLAV